MFFPAEFSIQAHPPPRCEPCISDDDVDGEQNWFCGLDCDDLDPNRRGGLPDPVGDGYDSDCSGGDGLDTDRDGFVSDQDGGDDCDDGDGTVHPGAPDDSGWNVEDVPLSGNLGTIALLGAGVPVVSGGQGPGCPFDEDGDGIAETVDSPGATTIDVAIRRGESWWTPGPKLWCATSRIDVATSMTVVFVHAGFSWERFGDGAVLFFTASGFPWMSDLLRSRGASHSPDASFAVTECADEYRNLFVNDEGWLVVGNGVEGRQSLVGPAGRGGEIAFDAYPWPHVAYLGPEVGEVDEEVRIARAAASQNVDPVWYREALRGPFPAGEIADVALAVEADGQENVAVLGPDGVSVLRPQNAFVEHPTVEEEIVDETPVYGTGDPSVTISIAVDTAGARHVVWVVPADPPSHGEIRYATNRGGVWEVEVVGAGDGWPDIAVDAHGNPHISWHTERRGDETSEHLARYATWAPVDGVDQNCDGVGADDSE